jgi:hypothetical protein
MKKERRDEGLPPVGQLLNYLMGASDNCVREVEVVRLAEAAGLERQLRSLLGHWVEVHAEAALCRLLLNLREAKVPPRRSLPARRLLRS